MKKYISRFIAALIIWNVLLLIQETPAQNFSTPFFRMYYKNKPALNIQKRFPVKKATAEEDKFDEPNKFAEFEREIRTRAGETAPQYPDNYIINALEKSRSASRLFKSSPLNWIERGPGNVSGRTRGIVVDVSDLFHKTWLAGSVGGGIWKTTDMGASWTNRTSSMPNLATTSLVQSQKNPNIIYCGTGEGFNNIDAVNGAGIFKSTDKGDTWAQLSSTTSSAFRNINRIIVDPLNENILLACTNQSTIQRSTDGGSTWLQSTFTNKTTGGRIQDLKADPSDFQIQYCTVNNEGVFKSTDGGLNWSKSSTFTTSGRIEIAVSSKNSNYIYASSEISGGSALYVSDNKGANWYTVKSSDGKTKNWLSDQGWYDNAIAVNPDNEKIVFLGGVDLWKVEILSSGATSTTRDANFSRITDVYGSSGKPYVHVDHHNITPVSISPGTFWIINGNDGGISYSTDGGTTWRGNSTNNNLVNGGYNTTQFYGVDKKPGASQYIGGTQDNGTWMSTANNPGYQSIYSQAIGGDGFDVSWHYKDPLKIIGGSQYNSFRRTTDGGINWLSATAGLDDVGSGKGPFISRIAKSNSDPDVIYAAGSKGIWRSEDFGATWALTTLTNGNTKPFSGNTIPVSVSIANPQVVWAGNRFTNNESRLYVSKDGGVTFDSLSYQANLPALGTLSGIDTNPDDMNTAYLCYSFSGAPKILRTTNLGSTWQDISGFGTNSTSSNGFPDVATYCVLAFPNSDKLWAGTEIGLFESTDKGANWHLADNGLPAVSIWKMRIVDDQVVVATHGRGIFSVTLSELSGYKPPTVTLSPLITGLSQGVDGALNVIANLRAVYDSTVVWIAGNRKDKINSSTIGEINLKYVVPTPGTLSVQIISYKSGVPYKSTFRNIEMHTVQAAQSKYSNYFDEDTNDFFGNGYTLTAPSGFSSRALNSPHPYSEATDYYYNLLVPIKISSASSLATIEYDDIALVEPGDLGAVFGDLNFWDYVVLEGSRDGINWLPFEDGYDCNSNASWLSLYNSNTNPTSSNYVHHTISMTKKFNPGETIFVRFHLYSDEAAVGWGWIVDNLKIQPLVVSVENETVIPNSYSLSQNYPNPFNPETLIKFSLPKRSKVKLEIFDMLGRSVATLADTELDAGNYKYNWNALKFSSGVYLYRLTANNFSQTKKLILMK